MNPTSGFYLEMGNTHPAYNYLEIPIYVGYYMLGGVYVNLTKKPNIIHRFFMNLLLGWKWTDTK